MLGRTAVKASFTPRVLSLAHTAALRKRRDMSGKISEDVVLFAEGTPADTSGRPAQLVTLNRPKALNALDEKMIESMMPKYSAWDDKGPSELSCVILKGAGGKAFCAGGDVVAVRTAGPSDGYKFFHDEYKLDYKIATLCVPQVALWNGFTMGGGVGVSAHNKYRVATDNTLFAMPETKIGFFPDVGASHFLPKLKGNMGMYLALTGDRLKGPNVYHSGVSTHYVPADKMGALEEDLLKVGDEEEIESVIEKYHEVPAGAEEFWANEADMNEVFGCASVDEMVDVLQAMSSENETPSSTSLWASKQLKTLGDMSPLSLKVTHRLLTRAKKEGWDLAQCFAIEYRLATRFTRNGEFFEGVRALLVDKDLSPKWSHPSLDAVTTEEVETYFRPFDANDNVEELLLQPRKSHL